MSNVANFNKDMYIISKLPNEPNDVGGLSPEELKLMFDQAGLSLQSYINTELVPAVNELSTIAENGAHIIVDKNGNEVPHRIKLKFNGAVADDGKDFTTVSFSASDVGAVPTSRKVNGQALTSDVVITTATLGAVPISRKVNGKALSDNIALNAEDVSARAADWTPTPAEIGAVPTSRTINNKALTKSITLTSSDVGALPNSTTLNGKALSGNISLTAADVSAVPTSTTINNKALSSNITLTASDISAVPTSRTVNSKALTGNITLDADDVGAVPATRRVNNKELSADISISAADVGAVADGYVAKTYSANTNAAITNALNDAFGDMTNGTVRYIRIAVGGSNLALTTTTWTVLVGRQNDTSGFAVGFASASNTPANALNTYANGGWIGWGYVNPNGTAGTTYRTAERFTGKAVYTKVISLGTTADKATFDTGLTVSGHRIIRYAATLNGTPLPYHYTDSSQDSWIRIYEGSTNYTAMLHTKDVGVTSSHLQIWYCER